MGYEQPVGEHLKHLAWAQGRPITCLAWSSAPRLRGSQHAVLNPVAGSGSALGLAPSGEDDPCAERRLGTDLWPYLLRRKLHRSQPVSLNLGCREPEGESEHDQAIVSADPPRRSRYNCFKGRMLIGQGNVQHLPAERETARSENKN